MKRRTNRILALTLTLLLSLALLSPAAYAANDTRAADTQALALKQLKLFQGVAVNDFALDRAPTRTEALVMLIRVLGLETEALQGNWTHPFTDVASWADKYIGYAYEKGLTKGVSATEFGAGNANADMYLTFMLRALGYDDGAGDFAWNDPNDLAASIGILPAAVSTADFMRADVALVSWAALEAKLKDGSRTLSQKLMDLKVFTSEEYAAAKLFVEKDGGVTVSAFGQLQAAADNRDITVVQVAADMDIPGEFFLDREQGPKTLVYIREGVTLTVSGSFISLGCNITNDGTIVVSGTFDRGLGSLTNNGTITVKSGGTFCSGMTDTYNYGAVTTDKGGNLLVERGTQFFNCGTITNSGYVSVDNGGSLNNDAGTIVNNGAIDLASYFSGNAITGAGTVNDKR